MSELTYEDFKQRINIQEVLQDAGYRLNRKPEEYTVGSILKLTEGGLSAVSCTSQGAAACSRKQCCEAKPMWDRLDRMINDFFEGITLADLLKDGKE